LGARDLRPAESLSLLFSDDRYVPSHSEKSNYHASLPLISALRLPESKVLRVRTELPLEEAAADYERRLAVLLDETGSLTLGVLGLGTDGHTASLFSLDDLERARGRLAIAVQRPDGMQAVSTTPSLLSRIDNVLMVVPGHEKKRALTALLAQDRRLIAWRAVEACPSVELWCEHADV
jgi:6-phosphogluconolactonase/glucosamine-6-phosphate isomerase/deaminase